MEIAAGLAAVARGFYARGWLLGTSGNLSAVVQREPLRLAMSPSGVDKGELRPEQFLSIDENARIVSAHQGKPSDESLLHLRIVKDRGAGATSQVQELPMAYNVEDFQIRYVLDDGTVTDNPSVGPDGLVGTVDDDWQQFNRIRQLTISVKVQSTEPDEKTGLLESISFSSTFSTRNLGYDAG